MQTKTIAALFFTIAVASAACSDEGSVAFTPVHGKGIVNGELEEGFPSTVSLGGTFGGDPMSMCSGNLITPKVILSAAHCGDGVPIEMVKSMGVAFFGADINDPDDTIGFDDLIIHPDYEELVSEPGGDLGQFDLSVFVLDEEAAVEPTWFRRDEITDDDLGAELKSVGFGVTSSEGEGSGIKRSATIILSDYDDNFLLNLVSDNPGETNICSGDSGGPQFFNVDGFWIQGAVHSWGDTNCAYSSGSTRVDIATEWILDRIEEVHGSRDVCEINGWYDDGICQPFCDELDPDCETDTGGEDAGPVDSGVGTGSDDGCGCAAAGGSPRGGFALLTLFVGLSALALRRARR